MKLHNPYGFKDYTVILAVKIVFCQLIGLNMSLERAENQSKANNQFMKIFFLLVEIMKWQSILTNILIILEMVITMM